MTICNITGYACDCQPDEGVPCDGVRKLREACESWKKQSIQRGQEIERLQAENQRLHHRCAALAYLHYGHYLVQRTPESVQADIEACESALTALRAELRALPQPAEHK